MNYCGQCGKELGLDARFCSVCGTRNVAVPLQGVMPIGTRLIRPRTGRAIAGVCQGLARSYGWDVVWVRVIAVLITIFSSGAGGIAYVIFWIVMPEELFALPAPAAFVSTANPPAPTQAWK